MPHRLTATSVRYIECLKNHAASTGGHAVDGCREFMAAGGEGTPGSFKCAACSCHRKETCTIHHNHHHLHPPPLPTLQQQHNNNRCCRGTPAPPLTGAPAESSNAEDRKSLVSPEQSGRSKEEKKKKKKKRRRLRTKFTQEQRDGMHEFAERIGWRMGKEDEDEVQNFCRGNGLKRDVFKVWIHNTKQAKKNKRQL